MTSREALKILEFGGVGYRIDEKNKAMFTIKKDLQILEILKGLFIERGCDCPYYDLNNRICVDTTMTATDKEIDLIKEWLKDER